MAKYETEVDLGRTNSSHTQLVLLAGEGTRVLDVGCAGGYVARALRSRGCTVSGVEYDKETAEQARPLLDKLVIADLETLDFSAEFDAGSFDAVLFGDVLEHVRDPAAVLRAVRPVLAPGGSVVISIPNVAHGDVRLALLKGRWDYRETGLLDATHLRFFTRASVRALLRDAGYHVALLRPITMPLFGTEIELARHDYDPAVIDAVAAEPDATTYQFVVRAVPADDEHSPSVWSDIVAEQQAEIAEAQGRIAVAEERNLRVSRLLHLLENSRPVRYAEVPRRIRGGLRRLKGRR